MDRRFDVLKTGVIRRHDRGKLDVEACQLRAVCRQTGCQRMQFAGDLRRHSLELRNDKPWLALRAELGVAAVIGRPAAVPAARANEARRPDYLPAAPSDTGFHGEAGKLAERYDLLVRPNGKHSRAQRFSGRNRVGEHQGVAICNQRDLEAIVGMGDDGCRIVPHQLNLSFKLGDGGLGPPPALLKKRQMLGSNGQAVRLLPQLRQITARIEEGKLIAALTGCSRRSPLHRPTPPRSCAACCWSRCW
jgi:hypothetical protein